MGEGRHHDGGYVDARAHHRLHALHVQQQKEKKGMRGSAVGSLNLGRVLCRALQLFRAEESSCVESQVREQVSSSSCRMCE